jgi:hypothetical protein
MKQKEMMMQAGGCGGETSSVVNSSVGSVQPLSGLTVEMKETLACLIYFLSCDCTMSPTKSIAVMGNVKTPSLARKIRLAILQYGPALSGILRLMMPSSNRAAVKSVSNQFSNGRGLPKSPPQQAKSPSRLESTMPEADELDSTSSPKRINPAKLGRMLRLKRKRLARENAEREDNDLDLMETGGAKARDSADEDSKMMPPPSKRIAMGQTGDAHGTMKSDELSFKSSSVASRSDISFPGMGTAARKIPGSSLSCDEDFSLASDATGMTSTLSARATQKLASLRSKVQLEAIARGGEEKGEVERNLQAAFYCERTMNSTDAEILPVGDYPWVTMVCLESLNRIMTGKGDDGMSCLEGQHAMGNRGSQDSEASSDSEEEDERKNPIVMTNHLLGRSGAVLLLGKAMSLSIVSARKLIFAKNHRINGAMGDFDGTELREDEECWKYCQDRLSLLASIIDGACLLSESNRRGFCEEDPFAFEERKDGLIFEILYFLRQCSQSNLHEVDEKRSATMLLALRTLTSLTHDNGLATEQLALTFKAGVANVRGVEILAELIFQLEEPLTLSPSKAKRDSKKAINQSADHDMHRYDCTIFCFNTLANVMEGPGVRKVLSEITVQLNSLGAISWLRWLCQWFVKQTETFHGELMSIGKDKQSQGSAQEVTPAPRSNRRNGTRTNTSNEQEGELQKHEEEKLVAAGNCCVVLACMMIEPENDNDDANYSTSDVRQLIVEEMPETEDGESSGVSMIINTLKAFCNYYHLSLGELSLAVVAPVKKLILELEETMDESATDQNQESVSEDEE